MENKECPNCGSTQFAVNLKCPYCGTKNPNLKVAEKKEIKKEKISPEELAKAKKEFAEGAEASFQLFIFILLLIFCFPAAFIYLYRTSK